MHSKMVGRGVEVGAKDPAQEKEALERAESHLFQKLGVVSLHKVRPDKSSYRPSLSCDYDHSSSPSPGASWYPGQARR